MKKINIAGNAQILLGCILYVIGVNFFLAPANIFTTGIVGLSQEIAQTISLLFGLDLSNTDKYFLLLQTFSYWVINVPILIFGFIKVGKKFTIKTFIISAVVVQLLINILVIDHSLITDVNGQITLASEILSLVAGSVLIGVGIAFIIKNKASSGGTDIIAVYLSLFKGKSFGVYNLLINLLVVLWAVLLTGDMTKGILILISLYIQGRVIDFVYNYNNKVTLMLFTANVDVIGNFILSNNRTYTQVNATKGYTKENIDILIVIINEEEKKRYIKELMAIDENIFIDIFDSSVMGNFKNRYLTNL